MESQLKYRSDRASQYEYLQYMGTYPAGSLPVEASYDMKDNYLVKYYSPEVTLFMNENRGDYVVSNPTQRKVDLSIKKMDKKVNRKILEDPLYYTALDITHNMFQEAMSSQEMNYDEISRDIVLKASPGLVEIKRGFKSKGSVMAVGIPAAEYFEPDLDEEPLWKVSPKVEQKTKHDFVVLEKIRTFIIQPFHHFWSTKRFFGRQNAKMMMKGWSYYGFNPYSGGVHRLALRLLKFKRFWMLDGKGWDRLVPHLRSIYDHIRTRHMYMSPLLEWIVNGLVNSVLVLPNGDKVYKTWGNNSGSGNTTTDNILLMIPLLMLVFLRLGVDPALIEARVFAAVFGDDVVGGDDLDCTDEELEREFRYVFTDLCGIELDPFVVTRDVCELTFLGFEFCKFENYYIPKYPLQKLCSSFMKDAGSMKPEAELSKMISLMLMSAGHGETVFNFFRSSIIQVILNSDLEECVRLREQNLNIEIPLFESVLAWYIGFEGSNDYSHLILN